MLNEFRSAFRCLVREPKFSLTVVATLALAIGMNAAMFSFFQQVLLRPLPYHEAERVAVATSAPGNLGELGGSESGLFAADFLDLRGTTRALEGLATYTADVATALFDGYPELIYGAIVSGGFFETLGAEPMLGRAFNEESLADGQARQVVLSHGYWKNGLGADPDIVGRSITLNRAPFVVTAVMPPDFDFPHESLFWASPAQVAPESQIGQVPNDANGRGNAVRSLIGRLAPGATLRQAEQELAAQIDRLPNPNNTSKARHLVPLSDMAVGKVRPLLYVLLGAVTLVLGVACMNVANLMLARGVTRQREIGIRLAIGSSRLQIARELLAESLALALCGGLLGSVLGISAFRGLVELASAEIPRLAEARFDGWALLYALAASLVAGVACGMAPWLGASKTDLQSSLKSGARGASQGRLPQLLRSGLVAGEIAVSAALLIAAALLLRSFDKLQSESWGFDPEQVGTARVVFMDERYAEDADRVAFYRALLAALERQPGFEAVGTSLDRIGESWIQMPFVAQGRSYATMAEAPQANYHLVSHGYLETMRIPLLEGRHLSERDDESAAPAVVVDETLARQYFPGESAVGKRVQLSWFGGGAWAEIVGVTARVKSDGPDAPPTPEIYIPFPQMPWNNFFVHVRSPLPMAAVEETLREVLREIDAGIPLSMIATMEEIVSGPATAKRFQLSLLIVFGGVALLLAAVGVYSVIDYGIAQRLRELGIRLALGGTPRSLVRLVAGESMAPVLVGLAAGVGLAAAAAFSMRALLFQVHPLDAYAFGTVPALLVATAALTCWLSARKAVQADPLIALRAE